MHSDASTQECEANAKNYVASQVELGVLRRVMPGEEEPTFTVGAVLVKEGQS